MPTTGIGRYTDSILREIARSGWDWVLFSHAPLPVKFNEYNNVTVRTGGWQKPMMGTAWTQVLLPSLVRKECIDLFWSPRHHLPLTLGSRLPKVVTIHDLVWKRVPRTMRRARYVAESILMPQSIKHADAVIAVSQTTADDVCNLFPKARTKTFVVREAAPRLPAPASFDTLAKHALQRPYVLFTGTLEPRKNLARLIHGFSMLPASLRDTHQLVIVGGQGWGGEDPWQIGRALGIENRMRILGYVSDETLATLMQHATVFAMPSLYEGFGLPLLEAMAHDCPVLSSSIGATAEVVGDAGVLVDPYSVEEIRDALIRTLGDDRLRSECIKKGRQRESGFSWQRAARRTMEIFSETRDLKMAEA